MLKGLYAITPDLADTTDLLRRTRQALEGGAVLVQYRNKTAGAALRREQALALLGPCRQHGVPLVLNDDLALVLDIGADGAHLGREDGDLAGIVTARDALGADRILGVSCYDDLARAEVAVDAGADYIAIGSVFASVSKPQATRASLATLSEAKRRFKLPVAAIGGITVKNAPQVIAAGADLLAVLSDLFDAMDIQKQAEKFRHLFNHS